MNPLRELTWHERHFVALMVGGVPAFVIGYLLGLYGYEIGGQKADLSVVLMRGGYCAVFPVILACLAPRSWLLPSLTYAAGFSVGIISVSTAVDGIGMLSHLCLAPFYAITGEHLPPHHQAPSHSDLPWTIGIALWLAALTSILRRRRCFAVMTRRLELRDE